jgi:hypothetical protein
MAKPRIFISSTFFDLKQIRNDLENFLKTIGYDPVLNERGSIPYGKDDKLEEYCYKEIRNIDILISIIGGRYGSKSMDSSYSVSNMELKTARDQGKQVYIFIEKHVEIEYETYLLNKGIDNFKYKYVDNTKVYEFIEEIKGMSLNNTISQFDSADDIVGFLKEQFAGLFQRLLQEQTRASEFKLIEKINSTSKTLDQLVNYLSEERKQSDSTINSILLINHPAFLQLQEILELEFPIIFTNFNELTKLLVYNHYKRIRSEDKTYYLFHYSQEFVKADETIYIHRDLFDNNHKIKIYSSANWESSYIIKLENSSSEDGDEMPF